MKNIINVCKIMIVLLFHCIVGQAQDPNFHIYLCFGQSNMEGSAPIESLDMTGVDARFRVMGAVNCTGSKSYTLGQWTTATPPLFRCDTRLGPADYFGRTMLANLPGTTRVGIVPVAVGGCDIALFDKVNYASYVATAPSWMKNIINQYGGNPYGRLVEAAKLAQKDGVIKGIIMHQGETNNGQTSWPAKVKAVYDNLIKDLNLDPTKTPLLVGELVTTAQGGVCGAHNAIIATVPNVIPNSYVISASGLPPQSDNLHFTSASYRTLGQRYAQKMLTLLNPTNNTAPTVSITSPANNSSFTAPAVISITANATDADGTVSNVQFFNGTTLLGSDATSPYSFSWGNVAAGTYTLTARATDNSGAVTTSSAITVIVINSVSQSPYGGTPASIPGTIQAENYDLGGQGVAFNETTSGNSGNATFRGDAVDMETTTDAGGGYNVGWINNGEWLEYTVNVTTAGTYNMNLRVAVNGEGRTLRVEMDGVNISGTVTLPNTGGWQTWQTVTVNNINLTTGQKVMRVTWLADYQNLNYISFTPVAVNTPPTVNVTSPANNATFTAPASVTINANATDADGTVSNVQFYNGTTLLGSDATSPYSFSWTNIAAGTYSITARATDNAGAVTSSSSITVVVSNPGQTPYGGTPASIPGTIQAENYDLGGQGVAFNETTAGNSGNATFRGDNVDIETTTDAGGGYNVGWIANGEWLEYTVNVTTAGTYNMSLRVAVNGTGRTLRVEMDGVNISGTVSVPNTGGWQTWQTITIPSITLTTGQKVMRVTWLTNYQNLNYISFTAASSAARLGAEEVQWSTATIAPNPADHAFTLSFQEEVQSVTVVNDLGVLMHQEDYHAEGGNTSFGEKFPSGLYVVFIQYSSGRTETRKVQKL